MRPSRFPVRRRQWSISRRRFLQGGTATLAAGLAGCGGPPQGSGDDSTTPNPPDTVRLEPLATGFTSPVGVETSPDTKQRFIVDQVGQIFRHDTDGLRDQPFLELRDRVVDVGGYDERGLLGMALHPEFADNGRFYLRYSAPHREGTPQNYSHTFVLSEFQADPGAMQAKPESERVLLEIPQPQSNHNAGSIAFGPDGYLYVGVGDGGGSNDVGTGHVSDWYDANTGGNGQDVTQNLLGSLLRIDVDSRSGSRPYGIPNDNPLVGTTGLDEHYAWGFRNPWRFSFDGSYLYVADVGQNQYEEVNLVEKGGNYGWNVREGTHCFSTGGSTQSCPTRTPDGEPLLSPIIEYSHSGDPGGRAVIGGYRYRGDALPGLQGRYVFADWQANGRLFVAQPPEGGGLWPIQTVDIANQNTEHVGSYVLAFGRDEADELLVATAGRATVGGSSGAVHRLRPA